MKLLIIGANGKTGRHVVEQALEVGHYVTAITRRPEATSLRHDRLNVVRGDVFDAATLTEPMIGQDAVITTHGPVDLKPTTVFSEGGTNILRAMERTGVPRLICTTSAALEVSHDLPLWQRIVIPYILHLFLGTAYSDAEIMERIVESSGVDSTIVRPPRLTDGPHRGRYRIAINSHLTQVGISRADLADYLIHHLTDPASYCARIELAY